MLVRHRFVTFADIDIHGFSFLNDYSAFHSVALQDAVSYWVQNLDGDSLIREAEVAAAAPAKE